MERQGQVRGGAGATAVDQAPDAGALSEVTPAVDALLASFLDERVADLRDLDIALEPVGRQVAELVLAGGKRLRPAFVYWGHRATGAEHCAGLFALGAAVELLHTFALIHDDVMDRSDRRRGRAAVHTALAALHDAEGLAGESAWYGVGGAILAGDMAFVWADRMFDEAPVAAPGLDRARRVFTELRQEVMAGQYLDLRLAGLRDATPEQALRVALLKSGRYSVTRPLQVGAAVTGCGERLDAALVGYGDAVGLAFQLRDDVLGLFGDPAATGKSTASDLREGKRTPLMLWALRRTSRAGRAALERILGDPHLTPADEERARAIVRSSGALEEVERLLDVEQERARRHLEQIDPPAREALEQLADLALFRVA